MHYEVDETLKPARDLMDTLRALRIAWQNFVGVRGCLIQQKDGTSGTSTDYVSIAASYGYAGADAATKQANAKASFDQIDTAFTAGNNAITQMLDEHLTK